jgi:hypothetical protein
MVTLGLHVPPGQDGALMAPLCVEARRVGPQRDHDGAPIAPLCVEARRVGPPPRDQTNNHCPWDKLDICGIAIIMFHFILSQVSF